jgi:hypothetical protein
MVKVTAVEVGEDLDRGSKAIAFELQLTLKKSGYVYIFKVSVPLVTRSFG